MDAGKVRYTPLYLQVKEVVFKRILNGMYRPGQGIPSEAALAEEFGTSISTVRQALSILVADGYLVKKQGKGTFVSEQKTTISFFTWIPEIKQGEKIMQETLDLFHKKHPSLQIDCIPTSYHVAKKDLVQRISGGNAPDVAHIQSHWTSYLASMGALERLEPLLDKENLENRFYDKDLIGGMYREKLYSAGWGLCPVSLFANKNVLREAGIPSIESPMTLGAFQAICQQVDRFYAGQEKYCYALSMTSDQETDFLTVYFFLLAFNGGFLNEQEEVVFNSPENVAGFTWLRNFVQTCRVFKSNIPDIRRHFAHGDIAFISDGPWVKYQLEGYTGEEFSKNFEVVLNPVHVNPYSTSWNYNHALAICSQSQYKLQAAQFIDDLTNDYEISNYYFSRVGHLPVNRKYLDDPLYASEFYRPYKRQITHAACINARNAMFSKAMAFCIDAVQKILYEGADIQQELDEKEYYLNILYRD